MITIIIILVLIVIFLIIKLIGYQQNIKNIILQLEDKNSSKSNFLVTSVIGNKLFSRLVNCINDVYVSNVQDRLENIKKEHEMKSMISSLSHDLRTPLTTIKGYISLLSKEEDVDKKRQYVSVLEGRLNLLTSMLDDLFTYTKVSDSQYVISYENVNIFDAICKSVAMYYDDFITKNITPTINFDNQKLTLKINQDLFSRVVQNLINNALKYGVDSLEIIQKDNKIIFTNKVQNGINIDVDRIFERFYREDDSRHDGSSGLGLCIVKSIVEKMGGSVSAEFDGTKLSIIIIFNNK